MKFLDALYGLLEQLPSEFVFLEVGEYVNLLQVEQIRILLLDGHIARRLTFLVSNVVNVMLFLHLVSQALTGIHPVHHVINLFRSQNVLVGSRKGLCRQRPDDFNVCKSSFFNRKHRHFLFIMCFLQK